MLHTVARVNHPDLEDCHRLWLIGLALHARPDGTNAYPGYDNLQAITLRGADRQRLYSNHCVALGLVELTKKGKGKGRSNVYKICLTHEAYPDDYGKTASDDKRFSDTASEGKRLTENPLPTEAVSDSKTACAADQNHLPNEAKPLVTDGKTACLDKRLTNGSNQTPNHNPQPNPVDSRGGGQNNPTPDSDEPNLQTTKRILKSMYFDQTSKIAKFGKEEPELNKLIDQRGGNAVITAFKECQVDPPWNNETTHPFRYLVDDFDAWLKKAERRVTKAATDKDVMAATRALAKQQHLSFWGTTTEAAEEIEGRIQEIREAPSPTSIFENDVAEFIGQPKEEKS